MVAKVTILVEGRGIIQSIDNFLLSHNVSADLVPGIRWVMCRDLIDRLVNYDINYFYAPQVEVLTAINNINSNIENYRTLVDRTLNMYSNNIEQIDAAVLNMRENYVVNKSYKLRSDGVIEIELKGYEPSTDFNKIMTDAVTEALESGQEVPIKYLRMVGKWN